MPDFVSRSNLTLQRSVEGGKELWHWIFRLGFPLVTEWTSRATRQDRFCLSGGI